MRHERRASCAPFSFVTPLSTCGPAWPCPGLKQFYFMLQRLRGAVRAFPAALAAGTLLPVLIATFPAAAQQPARPANPSTSDDHSVRPLQLVYSRWIRFCLNNQDTNAKQACFTGKDGRTETGTPIVAAVLIDPQCDP